MYSKKFILFFVVSIVLHNAVLRRNIRADTFYVGVYLYEYHLLKTANEKGIEYVRFLDTHFALLSQNGVNAIYLGGVNNKTPDHFEAALHMSFKHGLKIIPQLDFAYFKGDWSDREMTRYARLAGNFINKYIDSPQILAWSIKEEVHPKDLKLLSHYYVGIKKYAPQAKFQIIHNNIDAARLQEPPYPDIIGVNRYAFWWEFSGHGYLASPEFSLNWVRTQAQHFYIEAEKRNADFSLVITQGGLLMPKVANVWANHPEKIKYPYSLEDRHKMRDKILKFAEEGRMGWSKFKHGDDQFYNVWKYYRLPQNCMKALGWIAVLEGAKSFYCWSYRPPDKALLNTTVCTVVVDQPLRDYVNWFTLAGRPDTENTELLELKKFSEEVRKFENVIVKMRKQLFNPITILNKNVYSNAFSLPDVEGLVVVVVNLDVGEWPGKEKGRMWRDDALVYIDNQGRLSGYVPFTDPANIQMEIASGDMPEIGIYDITSRELVHKCNGRYHIEVMPGSGRLFFIGVESELLKIQ